MKSRAPSPAYRQAPGMTSASILRLDSRQTLLPCYGCHDDDAAACDDDDAEDEDKDTSNIILCLAWLVWMGCPARIDGVVQAKPWSANSLSRFTQLSRLPVGLQASFVRR